MLTQSYTNTKCINRTLVAPNNNHYKKVNLDLSNKGVRGNCLMEIISNHPNPSIVKSLDVTNNNLTEFVFLNTLVYPKLLYLDLQKNNLSSIPRNLPYFAPKLLELNLSGNQITELKSEYFLNDTGSQIGLPSLFLLAISRNKINNIREGTFDKGFGNLKRLYLDHNKINLDDSWMFDGLRSLILLDLKYNKIQTIVGEVLHFSKRLSFLYIDHNELEKIDPMTVVGLQLSALNVSYNNINKIHPYAVFKGFIKDLDMSYNNIRSIPIDAFKKVDIFALSLEGNPVKCDCFLKKYLLDASNMSVKGKCNGTGNRSISPHLKKITCDACSTNLCQNNAKCKPTSNTTFDCVCTKGFTGTLCKNPVVANTTLPPQPPQSRAVEKDAPTMSTGVVVVISIAAFIVGTLVSLLMYYRFIRPKVRGELRYSPFYVNTMDNH